MTPQSSMGPVQAAVYGILGADATLASMVDDVLDAVPEARKLSSYVLIGESIETPDNSFGSWGRMELLTIHTYVEDTQAGGGWKRAKDINARVMELLDEAEFAVDGRAFIYCHFDQSQTLHDGSWRHIATDFRVATEDPSAP